MSDPDHILSNLWYDRLKLVALVILPAFGAFYFALAGIWGLPKAEEVLGTVTAVDAFLGVVLKLSDKSYSQRTKTYDGQINVLKNGEDTVIQLDVSEQPEVIETRDEILFKVNKPE